MNKKTNNSKKLITTKTLKKTKSADALIENGLKNGSIFAVSKKKEIIKNNNNVLKKIIQSSSEPELLKKKDILNKLYDPKNRDKNKRENKFKREDKFKNTKHHRSKPLKPERNLNNENQIKKKVVEKSNINSNNLNNVTIYNNTLDKVDLNIIKNNPSEVENNNLKKTKIFDENDKFDRENLYKFLNLSIQHAKNSEKILKQNARINSNRMKIENTMQKLNISVNNFYSKYNAIKHIRTDTEKLHERENYLF